MKNEDLLQAIEREFEKTLWPRIMEECTNGDPVKIMHAESNKEILKVGFLQGVRVGMLMKDLVYKKMENKQ